MCPLNEGDKSKDGYQTRGSQREDGKATARLRKDHVMSTGMLWEDCVISGKPTKLKPHSKR